MVAVVGVEVLRVQSRPKALELLWRDETIPPCSGRVDRA
jgi:hypothetical protein